MVRLLRAGAGRQVSQGTRRTVIELDVRFSAMLASFFGRIDLLVVFCKGNIGCLSKTRDHKRERLVNESSLDPWVVRPVVTLHSKCVGVGLLDEASRPGLLLWSFLIWFLSLWDVVGIRALRLLYNHFSTKF